MIQIEHVSKTFSGKYGTVHALDDVSIHVEKGDICGIIGFSGAGKSTLIRLVNGLETADSGKVTVCGKELSTLKKPELRALRRKIGEEVPGRWAALSRFPHAVSVLRRAD